MNWGEIRSLGRMHLGDTYSNVWSDSDLLVHANHVIDDLATDSEANLVRVLFQLTQGTRSYQFGTDFYELRSVKIGGKKINGNHAFKLEELDSQYLTKTGTPLYYYQEDVRTLSFYPVPSWTASLTTFDSELGVTTSWNDGSGYYTFSSEYGVLVDGIDTAMSVKFSPTSYLGDMIQLDANAFVCEVSYVTKGPDLVSDSDIPDLPAYMHYAVLYGMLQKSFAREGLGQNPVLAGFYKSRYEELAEEWKNRNQEYAHGQDQLISQRPVRWGSDLDWRARVWP